MVSVSFTNERGNPISISVTAEDAAPHVAGVNITLTGPASTSENIMTRQEAEQLYAVLGRFLAKS